MTTLRSAAFLAALVFLWTSCVNASSQKVGMPPASIEQRVLSLNFANNGQHLTATLDQLAPRKLSGSTWPRITLQSVTVGRVPPRP